MSWTWRIPVKMKHIFIFIGGVLWKEKWFKMNLQLIGDGVVVFDDQEVDVWLAVVLIKARRQDSVQMNRKGSDCCEGGWKLCKFLQANGCFPPSGASLHFPGLYVPKLWSWLPLHKWEQNNGKFSSKKVFKRPLYLNEWNCEISFYLFRTQETGKFK